MTKHPSHDYLPAARHDALLPAYDTLARLVGMRRVYRTLIEQAELGDCRRVLEIGCGTGNLAIRAKRGHPDVEVVGSDPDPLALDRARRKGRRLPGIRFERGYAQRLPYAECEFDRVLSSMMLHHVDEGAKAAAAAEVFRVLRPGGRLHLVDITHDETPRLLRRAGFECRELGRRRLRIVGQVTYYRADRPRP
jgi:ubiquinone/menaquinone biosynthesis C-methylase UbiE